MLVRIEDILHLRPYVNPYQDSKNLTQRPLLSNGHETFLFPCIKIQKHANVFFFWKTGMLTGTFMCMCTYACAFMSTHMHMNMILAVVFFIRHLAKGWFVPYATWINNKSLV
jgi:hypothetical protein